MPNVLQMTRVLTSRPILPTVAGVTLRTFAGPSDIEPWLRLRARAFEAESPQVRDWTAADFDREFRSKAWWRPEAMWIAEEVQTVGSVILARRREAQPAVSWLMVDPEDRRRGIGRLLLGTLEASVWDQGIRQVWLETHANWQSVAFYRAAGYVDC